MSRQIFLAALLAIVICSPVNADVYRWVSGDGSVHFSDVPPRDRPYSPVRVRPATSLPMHENLKQSEGVERHRKGVERLLADGSENYATRKKAEELEKTCQDYREQLQNIQSQLRAGYSNDRGNGLRQKRRVVSQAYSRECILR
ncbi:MAG: DUF4124 domain-containing protein [Pseudomonadota bacterium]|nr:DUF4124 domain-containing protein [Pseudomonadota bacterium]